MRLKSMQFHFITAGRSTANQPKWWCEVSCSKVGQRRPRRLKCWL